jgi:hypothetical protein
MAFSAPLSHVVLVITATVLFYLALTDFKQFKIRNELIFALTGLLRHPRAVVRRAHSAMALTAPAPR